MKEKLKELGLSEEQILKIMSILETSEDGSESVGLKDEVEKLRREARDYEERINELKADSIICEELRKAKDVPVIFLSARSEDVDKIKGLGLGADDYIAKPFSPSEMVARVKAHTARYKALKSGGEKRSQELSIKGLTIDKDSRRVFAGKNEIILTVKEYDLLLFLLENPNIVFSKDRLFDRVWGMDAIGDSSTVTVHVQRVRDKLEKYTDEKFIETVWGAGYRFAT